MFLDLLQRGLDGSVISQNFDQADYSELCIIDKYIDASSTHILTPHAFKLELGIEF